MHIKDGGIFMSELNFDQKKTLAAFECFFGSRYNTNTGKKDNTSMHIETQKMCYLLKMAGIEIGDFDYSWNFRGPFSPGLLVLLRSIDRKATEVTEFYENSEEKEKLLDGLKTKIYELQKNLEIDKHLDQKEQWVEVLGSLTYISRTVLPGSDFEEVNKRLIQEKAEYCNMDLNKQAWNLLKEMKLLEIASSN